MNREQFMNITSHGYIRMATCVPRVFLTDGLQNADAHSKMALAVYAQGAQIAVFPELGLTGYSCQDLFLQEPLQKEAVRALRQFLDLTYKLKMISVVGLPVAWEGKLFNCAAVCFHGEVLAVIPKSYLPDYREFRESRWFATSSEANFDEVELTGSGRSPFGTDIIIEHRFQKDLKLAVEICEDSWVPIPPSSLAALNGATVLVNLSASNITLTKEDFRREILARGRSAINLAACIFVSAGVGESSTDLAWDGQTVIADRGEIISEGKRYQESAMAIGDVDLSAITQDRIRMGSFAENAKDFTKDYRRVVISGSLGIDGAAGEGVYQSILRPIDRHPFVPNKVEERDVRCREIVEMQVTSLVTRLRALPPGKDKIIVGVSGGRDSAHALVIACLAKDRMGKGRDEVIGVTMPGMGTSKGTKNLALLLMAGLGVTAKKIPITDMAENLLKKVDHGGNTKDTTYQNAQAWMRKYVELGVSSKEGGIVLGSSDLSELMIGYTTYLGDHASHYAVNSGVPKTLIKYLLAWESEVFFKDEPAVVEVINKIINLPVSHELTKPGEDEMQESEADIGPYELHDFFTYYMVRFGMSPVRVARMALQAFAGTYSLAEIKAWLTVFVDRFFKNQFKRSMLPDGPKVGSVGVSPRDELRIPSDVTNPVTWLEQIRNIPDN